MSTIGNSENVSNSGNSLSKIKSNVQAFLEKINESVEAIKVFDADGDGKVTQDELTEALNKGGQWGAFDEVSLEAGSNMDKSVERLKQEGATAKPTYNIRLQVSGAKVINESTNNNGVNVSYEDMYDTDGKLMSTEQTVSKEVDGKKHTVITRKVDNVINSTETIVSDSRSYKNSYMQSIHNDNGSNSDERITFTKDGNSVELAAFEFRDPDGTVAWEGTRLYVNNEEISYNDNHK